MSAQNERQPDRPVQPAQPRPFTAPRLLALEEEVEVLAAERELRLAHVKVAKIGAEHARFESERVEKAAAAGATGREDAVRARVQWDTALAQVQVREAELRITDVKLTYAKKRLEEAKAAPARPNPFDRPREPKVDPKPGERPDGRADAPDLDKLKAELERRVATVERLTAEEKRAAAAADAAAKAADELQEAAKRGRVRAGAIEAAEAKATEAKEVAVRAAKARKAAEEEAEALRKKIKDLQK